VTQRVSQLHLCLSLFGVRQGMANGHLLWHLFVRGLHCRSVQVRHALSLASYFRLFMNGMSNTCIFLPSRSWSSFTDPGGMEGWGGHPHGDDSAITPTLIISDQHKTRGNDLRLQKSRLKYDMRKFYFTNRFVDQWNSLHNCMVTANDTKTFKKRLDQYWISLFTTKID